MVKSKESVNDRRPSNTPNLSLWESVTDGYNLSTPVECKVIDSYLAFTMVVGICQLLYCALTKGFAYNSFIAAFSSSVGSFVFAGKFFIIDLEYRFIILIANARLKLDQKEPVSYEKRAHLITEFIICSIILNLFAANLIN